MQKTTSPELTVREADDGSVTIEGRAVPYGVDATIGGQFAERFAPDSVDPDDLTGAPILWNHDRAEVIGHITDASNADDGAHIVGTILPTSRGKDAALLLREGAVRGLSIGFEPVAQTWSNDNTSVTRTSVRVREVSVATLAAYPDAEVFDVRKETPVETPAEQTAPAVTLPDNLATRDDLVELEARIRTTAEPVATVGVIDGFTRMLQDFGKTRQTRALADVLSANNAGVLPPSWSSEVLGYVDSGRYFLPRAGSVAYPSSGSVITYPRVSQRTTVAARGTEKTEVPSQAFQTTSNNYGTDWYAGAVDIAYELILTSDPSILSMVAQDLLSQYAIASEEGFVASVEATGTAHGAVLDVTSYAALVDDLVTVSEQIRAATGMPGNKLAAITADWSAILAMVDADGRRVLAGGGATNSDGSANLVAQAVNIGGIEVFHSPASTQSVQFNEKALRKAERAPIQLSTDNVALAGRDLGILGGVIPLDLYTAGIVRYAAL